MLLGDLAMIVCLGVYISPVTVTRNNFNRFNLRILSGESAPEKRV